MTAFLELCAPVLCHGGRAQHDLCHTAPQCPRDVPTSEASHLSPALPPPAPLHKRACERKEDRRQAMTAFLELCAPVLRRGGRAQHDLCHTAPQCPRDAPLQKKSCIMHRLCVIVLELSPLKGEEST